MAKQTSRRWVALGSLATLVTACSLDLARLTQGNTVDGTSPAAGTAPGETDPGATPAAGKGPGAAVPGEPTGIVAGDRAPGDGGVDGSSDASLPPSPEPPLVTDDCPPPSAGSSALFCVSFRRAPIGQWPLQQVRDGSSVAYGGSGGAHDAGALYASVPEPTVVTPLRGKAYFRTPSLRPRALPVGTMRYVAQVQFWIDDAPPAGTSGRATLMSFVSAGQLGVYSQVALQLVVTANGLAIEAIQQVAEREPYRAYLLVTDKPDGFRGRWNTVELAVSLGAAGPTRWMNIAGAKIGGSKTKPGPIAQDPTLPLRARLAAAETSPPVDAPADGVPLFDDPWLEVGLPYTEAAVGSTWTVRVNDLFVFVEGG